MEVSRVLAQNNAKHGTVVTADFQEAGRGRIRDRRWEMEKGSALVFTIFLRFAVIPAALGLRTGLAVALAIEDFAPALANKALIKWPNDILLPSPGDQTTVLKVSGILAEGEGDNVHIGIGVNVSQKQLPASLRGRATSVSMASGEDYNGGDRYKLLEKILSRLHYEIGADHWRERAEARLYKKGGQVCFVKGGVDSGDMVTGALTGIGVEGELLIVPSGGTETLAFTAGEIYSIKI